MPFGSGIHMCPGNELAKLEILVLLHHLTTKYRLVNLITSNFNNPFLAIGFEQRHIIPNQGVSKLACAASIFFWCRWSVVGAKNGIQYGPFALPQNGLPITLFPKNKQISLKQWLHSSFLNMERIASQLSKLVSILQLDNQTREINFSLLFGQEKPKGVVLTIAYKQEECQVYIEEEVSQPEQIVLSSFHFLIFFILQM